MILKIKNYQIEKAMDSDGNTFKDQKLTSKIAQYEAGLMDLSEQQDLRDHLIFYLFNLNTVIIRPSPEELRRRERGLLTTDGGDY